MKKNDPTSKSPRSTRVYRDFTPEEDAMFERARAEDEAELENLKAEARESFARAERLQNVLRALKEARVRKGLSLADIDAATGIGKGNLSRLENDPRANPTLETLLRIADAIGVELRLDVIGKEAA